MAGAFSSINTALSALRYQQAALDIASTNIANASTDGYVRRRVVGQTVGAAAAPAVWSRSNEIGSGVQSAGVERLVDPLLDTRVRREHARQTYLDLKAAAMGRIETGIAEPSENGIAQAVKTFQKSLDDLNNAPTSDAARSQIIENAKTVADAFNIQSHNLQDEAGDQRARVLATVQEVNDTAQQLASTNLAISASSGGGSDTATLMDTRDQLALRLAELTGATATQRPDGGMDVLLNGKPLVTGKDAATLQIASGINPDGTGDGSPVTFQLQPTSGAAVSVAPTEGELAASVELIDVVIPQYAAGLNDLVKQFADDFNAAHALGYDANGNAGGKFFDYTDPDRAGTLKVVIASVDDVAVSAIASAVPGQGNTDTGNAAVLADSITIQDGYQRLVNGFGSAVASVQRLSANQSAMSTQVDAAREQLTGVSIDEETVNMVMAQRSYEAAARVMTTVDQILDTLINRTGMVGR
jgi:flagellar hook-associated protein 1 FlgK